MATLPLDVYEVLEQEYESHYPDDARSASPHDAHYDAKQIIDDAFARSILSACGLDASETTAVEVLLNTQLIAKGDNIAKLIDSPVLTKNGVTTVKNYDEYVKGKSGADAEMVRRRVVDTAFCGAVKPIRDVRLSELYAKLHAKPAADARTAFCISGGGIRSATFALGIIQGLAGSGILKKFEYLSTVSGGGYIGSWLSSWARRHPEGMEGVEKDLVRADTAVSGTNKTPKTKLPETKVDPEPPPLKHLREYSNYLSPRLGLTSADSWTIAALYIRNLLLNLLVLVPILAFIIAFPRFMAWAIAKVNYYGDPSKIYDGRYLLTIAIAFIAVGFGYLGSARPVEHGREAAKNAILRFGASKRFLIGCVLPLLGASVFLTLFWARQYSHPGLGYRPWFWEHVIAGWLIMMLAPFARYYARVRNASAAERRDPVATKRTVGKKLRTEALAALVGVFTNAGLLLLLAVKVFKKPQIEIVDLASYFPIARPLHDSGLMSALYLCLAVPLVLLVFFVQASIFVGLSSRVNEDYDREWWGRAGAMLIMTAAFLAVASIVSVFGPVLLYHAPAIIASIGGVSGIAAAMVGRSSSTSATSSDGSSKKASAASAISGALLVPLFCLTLLAAISLGTTWLIEQFRDPKPPIATKYEAQFESRTETKDTFKLGEHTFVQTTVVPQASAFSIVDSQGVAHLRTIQSSHILDLVCIFGAALLAYGLSKFIGVNRFSMHAFYRNRLIRAYLGASRYSRDPDEFTGFDQNDNIQMYKLRPELIWTSNFTNASDFITELVKKKASDPVATELWNRLDDVTRDQLGSGKVDSSVIDSVTQHINVILADGKPFLGHVTPAAKRAAIDTIVPLPPPQRGPMHVVNTTLNLTTGENLAWQQRKGESFTVTPLHCGSLYLGYRDAHEYGGDDGISLGNAVTISGAAASPNQGYNSSVPLAFLLTLLNVRLGAWLGNPGVAGGDSFRESHPDSNLKPLFAELTGSTNDTYDWIYLSDGGHFENLAMYEMVLRRCRYIVLSDGGCDPNFTFDDLGNAIRKIRTDLGVPIDIKQVDMLPRSAPGAPMKSGSYVATATIRYSAIDGETAPDGLLIYIKPSVYDGDFFPRDVYNYAQTSPTFPHETTADQFFSESQFESYRALGRHVVNVICGNYSNSKAYATQYTNVAAFAEDVRKRVEAAAHQAHVDAASTAFSAGTGEIASAIRSLTAQARESRPPMIQLKSGENETQL